MYLETDWDGEENELGEGRDGFGDRESCSRRRQRTRSITKVEAGAGGGGRVRIGIMETRQGRK